MIFKYSKYKLSFELSFIKYKNKKSILPKFFKKINYKRKCRNKTITSTISRFRAFILKRNQEAVILVRATRKMSYRSNKSHLDTTKILVRHRFKIIYRSIRQTVQEEPIASSQNTKHLQRTSFQSSQTIMLKILKWFSQ